MNLRVAVAGLLLMSLCAPGATGQVGATEAPESPVILTAVQWDEGTLLVWLPAQTHGVSYVVYRGPSPDELVRIGETRATTFYDSEGDAGPALYYGVTTLQDGVESAPTIIEVENQASCIKVGMNGSVAVTPYRCLPYLGS